MLVGKVECLSYILLCYWQAVYKIRPESTEGLYVSVEPKQSSGD